MSMFPSETIDLPSKGVFYPEGSPLREGKLEIKYLTAKEEDILTSTNLIQKGIVFDKLCDSIILTPGVKVADLLVGDANAVIIASRILGYGKEYPIKITCPLCGTEQTKVINLTELEDKEFTATPDADGLFSLTLPSGKQLKLRLLTRGDEQSIDKEVEKIQKSLNDGVSHLPTTRLRYMIASVDGSTSKIDIAKFVENMLVRDTRAIREFYQTIQPDVNFMISYDCTCENGSQQKVRMIVNQDFFWPDFTAPA